MAASLLCSSMIVRLRNIPSLVDINRMGQLFAGFRELEFKDHG